jgi:hypothetical protein
MSKEQNPTETARRYLDAAIRRHRKAGDDQAVPSEVYEQALARTRDMVVEFAALGERRSVANPE